MENEKFHEFITQQFAKMFKEFEGLKSDVNDVKTELQVFRKEVDKRFEDVDKRFEAVDKRFDEVDKRFEAVDKRFDEVDKQFVAVDKRFDRLEEKVDQIGGLDQSDIEQIARQVEKLIVGQESLQESMNYLLDNIDLVSGKTLRLERDIRELKKAK